MIIIAGEYLDSCMPSCIAAIIYNFFCSLAL
jgi:hypothetical protein